MKTYSAKPGEITRKWFVVDATDKVLGRLATRVATVLRGKHKPVYTPHADTGDFVIVINAEKVKLTGAKLDDKIYRTHSLYPGGLREMPYRKLLATHPERAIERAVKGMLPKGTLGRNQLRKLKVYAGEAHPHVSQKPEVLDLEGPIPVYAEPVPPRTKKVVDRPEKQDTAETEDEPKPKAKAKAKAKPKAKPKAKAKAKPKAKAEPKADPKPKDDPEPKAESDDEPKTGSVDADEAPDETKES